MKLYILFFLVAIAIACVCASGEEPSLPKELLKGLGDDYKEGGVKQVAENAADGAFGSLVYAYWKALNAKDAIAKKIAHLKGKKYDGEE